MPITTLDGYIASAKQELLWIKTASRTSVALIPFTVFDLAGNPGAGTLAIGNTANGVVPTDATAGYPVINAFGGGATGYLSKVTFGNTVISRITLYDRVFAAGAYAFNDNTTLASQPSYSSRVPGGTDFNGLEIWIEAVTAFTGNQSIRIQYLDQGGAAGDSGTIATGVAPIVGRALQINLAAGDSGVQRIDVVTSTVSTAGTFNVMVLRKLWEGRVAIANTGDIHDILKTGLIQVFADSAFYVLVRADSTATGLPNLSFEVANA